MYSKESNANIKRNMLDINWLQLLRFFVVGGFTAGIYFFLIYLLHYQLKFPATASSSAAYIIVVVINYLLHYVWTFESNQLHKVAISRYLLMCLAGFLINISILYFGLNTSGNNFIVVQAIAFIAILLWNILASSLWVFKSKN
jgi:putative flippase GtrA